LSGVGAPSKAMRPRAGSGSVIGLSNKKGSPQAAFPLGGWADYSAALAVPLRA
jgi:hypothetical protein